MDQMGPGALPQRQEEDHLRPRPPPEKGQDSHRYRNETMRVENDKLAPLQSDQEGTEATYLNVHRTHPRHERPRMTGFTLRAVHPARKGRRPHASHRLKGTGRTRGRVDLSPGRPSLGMCITVWYIHASSTQRQQALIWTKNPTFRYIQLIRIPTCKLTPEYGVLRSGSCYNNVIG